MTLIDTVFAPLVGPATWGLIHFVWQGSLVALVLAAVLILQRRAGAVVRYRTSCAALVILVALPVATAISYDGAGTTAFYATHTDGGVTAAAATGINTEREIPAGGGADSGRSVAGTSITGSLKLSIDRFRPWIFAGWLAGVFILSLVHAAGWRRAQRVKTSRIEPVPDEWLEIASRLCRLMGVNRAVTFVKSALVDVPTVIGWLSPVVLIPAGALTGLTQQQLRSLLAHELAHVKRRDYLVGLLQVVAETFLFFHPAVWWVSKQIRKERENCCDDVAAGLCENRLDYARALLHLEELRGINTGFAMRADGGSLLARIHRLTGGNSMSTHSNKPWLAGLFLASLLIVSATALSLAGGGTDKPDGIQLAYAADRDGSYDSMKDEFELKGKWEMDRVAGVTLIHVEVRKRSNRMNMMLEFNKDDFTGLDYGENDQFELHRDAGSFYFTGDFEGSGRKREGSGKFGFVADYDFADKIGIRRADEKDLFILASKDIGENYIKEMEGLGYDDLDGDELIKMAIHGVSVDFVRDMREAGYDARPDELVKWRIHGVSADFAREMADAGFDTDSADQLVKYRIHGVSPEFVREMKDLGIRHMRSHDLVKMKIHGVSPEFVHGMDEAGYESLDVNELVKWRIHGVSPEYVAAMRDAGVERMRTRDLTRMRIHGVSPSFVRDLNELGYKNIDVDDLVRMRIHGVSASYIERILDRTTEDPSINELIKMKIHGIRL